MQVLNQISLTAFYSKQEWNSVALEVVEDNRERYRRS